MRSSSRQRQLARASERERELGAPAGRPDAPVSPPAPAARVAPLAPLAPLSPGTRFAPTSTFVVTAITSEPRTSLSDLVQPGSPVGASANPALGYEQKPERKLLHPRNAAERNLPRHAPRLEREQNSHPTAGRVGATWLPPFQSAMIGAEVLASAFVGSFATDLQALVGNDYRFKVDPVVWSGRPAIIADVPSSGSQLYVAADFRFHRIACNESASTRRARLATSATLASGGSRPASMFDARLC